MNNKLDYIAIDFETANQYRNSACSVGLVRFEISYTDGAWNSFDSYNKSHFVDSSCNYSSFAGRNLEPSCKLDVRTKKTSD